MLNKEKLKLWRENQKLKQAIWWFVFIIIFLLLLAKKVQNERLIYFLK